MKVMRHRIYVPHNLIYMHHKIMLHVLKKGFLVQIRVYYIVVQTSIHFAWYMKTEITQISLSCIVTSLCQITKLIISHSDKCQNQNQITSTEMLIALVDVKCSPNGWNKNMTISFIFKLFLATIVPKLHCLRAFFHHCMCYTNLARLLCCHLRVLEYHITPTAEFSLSYWGFSVHLVRRVYLIRGKTCK
jgi:hypothetical protein